MSDTQTIPNEEMTAATPLVFTPPTRQAARAKREQEARGFLFTLDMTGGQAHVRHLSFADKSTLAGLPTEMQTRVLRIFEEEARKSGNQGPLTMKRAMKNISDRQDIADALCLAGFIQPLLVQSDAELDPSDPYVMLVTDLHPAERRGYADLCLTSDTEAITKKLAPFPDATLGVVDAVPPREDGGQPLLRSVGDAGSERVGRDAAGL